MDRRTPGASFIRAGRGVHSGRPVRVRVGPARWGTGLRVGPWGGPGFAVRLDAVVASGGATVLRGGGHRFGTVEHLLAALVGYGITDAHIEVEGDELPILDGSSLPWCQALDRVGGVEGPPLEPLRIDRMVRVRQGAAWAELGPSDLLEVEVWVDFDDPALPTGRASLRVQGARFRDEVAWARTFVLERDIARLRAAGRGLGATPDNTVVIGSEGPHQPLRAPDEVVRHKLLDAVGDLALAGAPVLGRLVVHRGSHALHHAVLREWLQGGDPISP